MTEEEFAIAIHAIEEYAVMLESIQQELNHLKAEVKEYMRTHGLTEIEVDGRHVRLQETRRNHLDTRTLKTVQPDLYREYCRQIEVSRLIIS